MARGNSGHQSHFVSLGLTHAQVDEMKTLAARISTRSESRSDELMGGFRRVGINEETVGWLKKELVSAGLTTEQIKPALGGMVRVIGGIKWSIMVACARRLACAPSPGSLTIKG